MKRQAGSIGMSGWVLKEQAANSKHMAAGNKQHGNEQGYKSNRNNIPHSKEAYSRQLISRIIQ
jgi:hypothetical protein